MKKKNTAYRTKLTTKFSQPVIAVYYMIRFESALAIIMAHRIPRKKIIHFLTSANSISIIECYL